MRINTKNSTSPPSSSGDCSGCQSGRWSGDLNSRSARRLTLPDHSTATAASLDQIEKLQFLVKVAGDARLTASDLRCATVITDLYNATKQRAWPSYSRLISATHLSRATVARSVKHLHELSIIAKEPGGKGRSNSYRPSFGLTGKTDLTGDTGPVSSAEAGFITSRETRSYYSSCEDTSEDE